MTAAASMEHLTEDGSRCYVIISSSSDRSGPLLLASVTGLQSLAPAILAAFSKAIGNIQSKQQQQQISAGNVAHASAAVRLAVFWELPNAEGSFESASISRSRSSSSSSRRSDVDYRSCSSRADVTGAIQRWGRCVALQPPSLTLLLECSLRQLG
jgi:hypothetical protein